MRQFFYRIGQGIRRFMAGRYGTDQLNLVLLVAAILIDVLYMFTGFVPLSIASTAVIVYTFFRMLSRNIPKRYAENQKMLKFWKQLKMLPKYHIYRCKNCKQKIRVPRKGGKRVEIRCPKCGNTFIKRI